MPYSEHVTSVLTEEERKRARAETIKKSLRYFENRSLSQDCIFTRRRNLSAHLGVDETVSKKELQMINVHALPLPASVQKSSRENSIRYRFRTNKYSRIKNKNEMLTNKFY